MSAAAEEALKGSAEAGEAKAAVCTACHGLNGNSANPEWPSLAGQNAAYIREQLEMFKSRKRINEVMHPVVAQLTDRRTSRISPSTSPRRRPRGLEADPSYWKAGEVVVQVG